MIKNGGLHCDCSGRWQMLAELQNYVKVFSLETRGRQCWSTCGKVIQGLTIVSNISY